MGWPSPALAAAGPKHTRRPGLRGKGRSWLLTRLLAPPPAVRVHGAPENSTLQGHARPRPPSRYSEVPAGPNGTRWHSLAEAGSFCQGCPGVSVSVLQWVLVPPF